jgi:hypothetical protein
MPEIAFNYAKPRKAVNGHPMTDLLKSVFFSATVIMLMTPTPILQQVK